MRLTEQGRLYGSEAETELRLRGPRPASVFL
jgi:hypothetical protein